MNNLFNRPYKEGGPTRQKFVSILAFGLFIFLFLFLFKPFGLSQLIPVSVFFITLGFGCVTTFVLFIFKYLLEPLVTRNNWTFGKSLLWVTFIASSIGVANYFYITIIFHQAFVFKYLLYSIWTAILVGCIPVTINYIITFNRIYRTKLEEASIPAEGILWESEIVLRAGNPKNEVKLNPKNIVYLCSNDNYVTVVIIKNDVLNKTTIRGTLKSAELELRNNSRFLRCHKCYIVNLDFVERVTGHNQNMKIRLSHSETEIPVARSKAEEVSKKVKRNKL
jgi:hypothetical protein